MLKSILLATAFASTLGATAAFASPEPRPVVPARQSQYAPRAHVGWTTLGELRVGGRRGHVLEVGRDAGRIERLRLVVRDGDLGPKTVRVTLGNGQTIVSRMFGKSQVIDLPGHARNVRAISIDPAGFARRDRATVLVLADRAAYAWR
jgi:hypothetical protein